MAFGTNSSSNPHSLIGKGLVTEIGGTHPLECVNEFGGVGRKKLGPPQT